MLVPTAAATCWPSWRLGSAQVEQFVDEPGASASTVRRDVALLEATGC